MAKELLCDYKDRLKSLHKYGEEQAQNIAMMSDSFIEYYGEEYREVINDAIASCEFITAKNKKSGIMETPEDILRENGITTPFLPNRDLKSATVAFGSAPAIEEKDGTFTIKATKRVMAISPRFNWENPDSLSKMGEETERLINSYLNGLSIEGSTLTAKEGLSTKTYSLETKEKEISITKTGETGAGIERGIREYTAQAVTRENYFPEYDATGHDYERLTAGYMLDSLELGSLIRTSRMTKNASELRSTIDSITTTGYDAMIDTFDCLALLDDRRMEHIGDTDELKEATATLDAYFKTSIASTTSEMAQFLGKLEIDGNVLKQS